jgi:hypothetical protein
VAEVTLSIGGGYQVLRTTLNQELAQLLEVLKIPWKETTLPEPESSGQETSPP